MANLIRSFVGSPSRPVVGFVTGPDDPIAVGAVFLIEDPEELPPDGFRDLGERSTSSDPVWWWKKM